MSHMAFGYERETIKQRDREITATLGPNQCHIDYKRETGVCYRDGRLIKMDFTERT